MEAIVLASEASAPSSRAADARTALLDPAGPSGGWLPMARMTVGVDLASVPSVPPIQGWAPPCSDPPGVVKVPVPPDSVR